MYVRVQLLLEKTIHFFIINPFLHHVERIMDVRKQWEKQEKIKRNCQERLINFHTICRQDTTIQYRFECPCHQYQSLLWNMRRIISNNAI